MDFELPTPDISWDLDRLDSDPPTEISSQPPSSAITLAPAPATHSTATPSTIASATLTQTLAPSSHQASSTGGSPTERAYYLCSPLGSEIDHQDGRYETGNSPLASTVRFAYYFQVQILSDHNIAVLLPTIESRFESSLGQYLKANTVYDESQCEGYYVEDFRRRNLNDEDTKRLFSYIERSAAEVNSTKIIGISHVSDLSVDETQSCVPRKEQCHIVRGELDATYVGPNEAGVKASLSRVIKEEMAGDSKYNLKYLGSQYQSEGNRTSSSPTDGVVTNRENKIEDSANRGYFLSPIGIGIIAVLGSTFLIACYVLFIKSDRAVKVKKVLEQRKEKKITKKNALCEEDDEKRMEDQEYCYDLQSITIDYDFETENENGVEINTARATRYETESVHDSETTRKISNKMDDPIVFTFAYEEDESTDCPSPKTSSSQSSSSNSIVTDLPKETTSDISLVDRFPSACAKSIVQHKKSDENCAICTLPPISESLSPPVNDTPRVCHRLTAQPDAPGRDETGNWEV